MTNESTMSTVEFSSETIDNLPSGRELDSLVATRVMGWKLERHSMPEWVGKNSMALGYDDRGRHLLSSLPEFSQNIRDAWEVLEKSPKGWASQIHRTLDGRWCCQYGLSESYAETPSLAICRASLKETTR